MTISKQINAFADRYGKNLAVDGTTWRYYRLGNGAPILWLSGGLRRAAIGFAFLEKLAQRHAVIAPDYPPLFTIGEFIHAFDAILQNEGVGSFTLGGQSYGGILAQVYLAHKGKAVERLILSSTGPAVAGTAMLPVLVLLQALARVLPERNVKRFLAGKLLKVITVPETERAEWTEAINRIMQKELSREDVVSHFAVVANMIRKGTISPAAFRDWKGRIVILAAKNDPTQDIKDFPRYEKLFGRPVEVIDLGNMGHSAALFDTDRYVALFEKAMN